MNITQLASIMSPDEQERMIRHFVERRGIQFVFSELATVLDKRSSREPDDDILRTASKRMRDLELFLRENAI